MDMKVALCSSCKHHELYGERRINRTTLDVTIVPPPNFCPKCGSEMILACPGCESEIRSPEDKFCTKCGKPYK